MPSQPATGISTLSTPNDTDLVLTRVFQAPRRLVYDAHTVPAHIRNWMLGPPGWTMPVCQLDLRAGGAWRYVWRKGPGEEMEMTGTVVEVRPPERVVTTERWGADWPETINTLELTESGGFTTMTLTIRYASKAARERALGTGMTRGMDQSYARLDDLLRRQPAPGATP